jgi:pimeloyl-ACP methyl ester carboxylesterase
VAQIQYANRGNPRILPRGRSRHGAAGLKRAVRESDWPFRADDAAVLKALASGTHVASLRAYFGAPIHAELAKLAASGRKKRRRGTQLLILPGIMGSKLGTPATGRKSGEMLWFDPAAIGAGALIDLAIPQGRPLVPRGTQLFGYAQLLLELRQQGFDASLHPYDWRLGLDELGCLLAARIAGVGKPVILIGHSMGGLVARMAIALLPKRLVRKVILLGTPNFGSFAAVQALRGTYGFVRKVSRLDLRHSPQHLASHVFHTFPGLYQLLPAGGARHVANMCRRERWPATGLQPDRVQLARVAGVRGRLAPPDGRMVQIAGINRATVVGVRRKQKGFAYQMGWRGDGTVPLDLALLPQLPTYFVEEQHARLACNGEVIRAISEILRFGRAYALPRRWRSRVELLPGTDDATLQKTDRGKIDWRTLDAGSREAVMADLNS